ncbi:hypothetical protein JQV19_08325 [Sulfitobacter mediterraneus]|uniref:hypothetical protein n=1 Tax=Sulfitobacter mediterraneus TaxID=83219 RepID=UPI00193A6C4E|nr:hypothetical protein [Sulfitobacter mediterraneus]MBM1556652.1 hypothetical protein [Sulfitobacter mediterraneus]MBM1570152.1 hypothetical protein [Sulfitobacter mediterraneus]MBM1574108.1 hypothetical protein [Sulfitobacter mediterraneus]MBM1577894.1 hypothetical protein [Sulfitobacter mediterraneus]MBM1579610.1 hypothetical protein [Sulfitobacter mediterraneus]
MTAPERKDAATLVDEWLMETENYGLRIERLAESFPSDMGELMPWLVAACDCGLSQRQAALDRIAELEGAIREVVQGNVMDRVALHRWDCVPSKLDRCRHGNTHSEGCDNCDAEYLIAVLAKGDGG